MPHEDCPCNRPAAIDRRHFTSLAAAGGAAMIALAPRLARAAGEADALLLTCMDYRLTGKVTDYMSGQGLAGKYDHVILAGASLGAVTSKFPDWGRTFRQHLDVAIELHRIHEVIVIDHRDCGAYKVILGRDDAGDPAAETKIHAEMLHRLRAEIHREHPTLGVRLGLMALDGSVEPIA
ncbi:MAG TPA: carbonic anhydrase [Stellaceae bacterium]|nr:carbonic anhydrase [Stellaceae bacterium]